MDLFGIKEHDAQHAELAEQVRYLLEQVATLTIDLGQARADIERLRHEADSVDPSLVALDAGLSDARAKLRAAKSASAQGWSEVYAQLQSSLADVQDEIDAAGSNNDAGAKTDGPE
jgi:chromosome segregation ATPase